MRFILVFITASSKKEARRIVSAVVKKRLAACGNIVAGVNSTFMWQGRIRKANEVLVMLKTKAALFGDIVREVQRLHSYELPEVIAVPISKGNKGYLSWIDSNVR